MHGRGKSTVGMVGMRVEGTANSPVLRFPIVWISICACVCFQMELETLVIFHSVENLYFPCFELCAPHKRWSHVEKLHPKQENVFPFECELFWLSKYLNRGAACGNWKKIHRFIFLYWKKTISKILFEKETWKNHKVCLWNDLNWTIFELENCSKVKPDRTRQMISFQFGKSESEPR